MNCLAPVAADVSRLQFVGDLMERTDVRCYSVHLRADTEARLAHRVLAENNAG
ncbi:MAG: hypothetical protein KGS61_14180 [Verrucomicrobia bacterium]|nr:hypothetical protein [Verrucomicrobiota bacterium]